MHEVLVNRLGGLSLPRKSVVRLTNRPDMTFAFMFTVDVKQQHNSNTIQVHSMFAVFRITDEPVHEGVHSHCVALPWR